jgi:IclR family pca regulon transcriptional regulator
VARPHLEDLASAVGEATGMAVLDDTEVRYAIRISSARIVSANIPPGSVFPPHATALGKVLLAALEPEVVRQLARRRPFERFTPTTVTSVDELLVELRIVAEQGYAASNEEWEPGLRSLAAPVHSRDQRAVAAVCVTVVRPGVSICSMEHDLLPGLLRAAEAISAELGYRELGSWT